MRCGACKTPREPGDVCCLAQAANQGRLHAWDTSPLPEGLTPEFLAAYEAAVEEALAIDSPLSPTTKGLAVRPRDEED